ncbi:uncharacterized protein ASPGLDRAFT_129530 [Aspergillus glaucus CBS 516.65]|uniref:PNPLA domain-containing protein n=1 Tax=Aspergillus glaucus CBS 516.65 TaxID=1160497 RepID=A0A1L9VFA4_ASPGL|nr:hypothetical protein ASPGLDRAFT_129530 [Aspergillus glaucus CBS 516.65]OJJ82631.1 hypothetical protein ASPGLDRAFT_129530 [Aspergillus glaucus CBS 516.65]
MAIAEKKLNLLSLDGGGIRGLSSLYILKHVMESINPDYPPKPCEYFDMIAGTSTGGLIAIMLGRLKMGVNECIDAYNTLATQAFTRKAYLPITLTGHVKERFDSKQLEAALKKAIADRLHDQDALLKDPDTSCRVVLCATRAGTSTTVALRSYCNERECSELYNTVKIWEAGRATSAASSFFDPITIGPNGQRFFDGATGANNPIRHLWMEAKDIWSAAPLEEQIGCIVSIGTGVPQVTRYETKGIGGLKTLKACVTETEYTKEEFAIEHSDLVANDRYFRFNVPDGLADIGLEKVAKIDLIVGITENHLAKDAVRERVQACAGSLSKSKGYTISKRPSSKTSAWEVTGLARAQVQGKFSIPHIEPYLL